jgi:transposase
VEADPEQVREAVEIISTFLLFASQGLIDVYFCDESGFSLQPYIPYCYQKKGTQYPIPSSKKKVINVLGFLNPITNRLITYKVPDKQTMKSEIFIELMSDFAEKIEGLTVLILDNASWHKSALTKSMFSQWEKKGLFIRFLPPRCPHLNLIETLWRKIKYEWLKTADFYSEKTMLKKLKLIFKNYGNDFCINFSMNIFKTKFNW